MEWTALNSMENESFANEKVYFDEMKKLNEGDRMNHQKGPQTGDLCYNCGRKGHWYYIILYYIIL